MTEEQAHVAGVGEGLGRTEATNFFNRLQIDMLTLEVAELRAGNERLQAALEAAANRLADEGYGRWAREARAALAGKEE